MVLGRILWTRQRKNMFISLTGDVNDWRNVFGLSAHISQELYMNRDV